MRDVFQNIFFNSEKDPLTDYVSCKDLSSIPRTIAVWRTHSDRYVELASKLSLCVHFSNLGVRRCSRPLHTAYRRLENYAEYTGIIDRIDRKYKGFGKLIECRVTFEYESKTRPSLNRSGEVGVFFAIPLYLNAEYVGKNIEIVLVNEVAPSILYEAGLEYAIDSEYYYQGCREIDILTAREIPRQYRPFTKHLMIEPIGESWCNNIVRCSYDTAWFTIEEHIHGYYYTPIYPEIDHEDVLEIISPIYRLIVIGEKYW